MATMISPSSYILIKPPDATTPTRRIAVRGPPRRRVNAAPSMQVTRRIMGMLGKARLIARPIIVQENRTGKMGPPRKRRNRRIRGLAFSAGRIGGIL
jgi:hypothetical protein